MARKHGDGETPSGAVTLRDVAQAAGVGASTVVRVIRNSGAVKPETRAAVEKAILQLGYSPNRIAGALRSGANPLIGLVVPSTQILIFSELLHGVQKGIAGEPFGCLIAEGGDDPEDEEKAIRALISWRPTAMLVVGLDHSDAVVRLLQGYDGRVIEMMDIDGEPIDTAVGFSNAMAGKLVVQHLLSRGYRRIAYVGQAAGKDRQDHKRFLAMQEALNRAGLEFVDVRRSDEPGSAMLGRNLTAALRQTHPDVAAIVYANDLLALGGVFHCMAKGVRLPDELAIFGFNAGDLGQGLPQALSTVDTRRDEIGFRSVREAIEHPDRPARPQRIDTGVRIIPGDTA